MLLGNQWGFTGAMLLMLWLVGVYLQCELLSGGIIMYNIIQVILHESA